MAIKNFNVIDTVYSAVKYDLVLIRYGELALKGEVTRRHFEFTLLDNIKNALDGNKISFELKRERGRFYLYTDKTDQSIYILKKIFGIYSVSPAVKTQSDMESISKYALDISKKVLTKEKSFALRVTRTGNHDFTSQDVAVKVGADICKATKAKVNLTNPYFELFIEIRDKTAFIFTEKIHGAGGLPLGTQGKVLSLVDGPKSLLAAWYLMRRGCEAIFVNLDTKYNKTIRSFAQDWYVHEDIINVNVHGKNLYKKLNEISSEKDCSAIVTAHSLYDAKSKFLTDTKPLKQYTELPVLHPLIVMDQKTITKKCKEIGLKV